MQPRTLAILVVILPLLASNGAYLLSAYKGFVPWCMPYIDGCTTISQAGRSGNTIFFYRTVVFPYSVLLILFWLYANSWLELLHGHTTKIAQIIFWLGLTGAIALLIYINFLGAAGEINSLMRRIGAMLYFTLTPLAQLLMLKQHYNIFRKKPGISINLKLLQYQLIILLLMLVIVAISIFMVVTDDITYEIENIVEWNFSLLVNLYFAGMILIWKDYRHVFKISEAKNN
jgi:hypothetical protein